MIYIFWGWIVLLLSIKKLKGLYNSQKAFNKQKKCVTNEVVRYSSAEYDYRNWEYEADRVGKKMFTPNRVNKLSPKISKKRYTSIQRKFSSRPPCNLMHTHSFKFSFNSFLSPNFHSSCIWLKHYTFSLHIFISCSIVLFGSMKCIFIK